MATSRVVFVFSLDDQDLFQEIHGRLMNTIAQKAVVKQAANFQEALNLLNSDTKPEAIFVTDSGITTARNNLVSEKLVDFVRSGGRVVLGGLFSSFVRPDDLRRYFKKTWNLPWKVGSYHRTTVALNQNAKGLPSSNLPSSYSQKAVFLADVNSSAAWYLPTEDSVVESHVFAPVSVATSETPVVFAEVGTGWLGYIGSVNSEEETDTVVLGMLGLL
ncbi:uncharacterized protein A1O5_11151 [Cladophialophora psammophila CBS 110553]|uniref:Uncharacterized protein n=1 Tax=Cladophialophora psammophila CBS 110553 TaxID=1182543 RepID=W9X584_9EURO|nr:uncharacterized protein A1O5_11151 [Cladophialophora psammophila CBS 110553]EXJ65624.1 hypothetical protein A1O5_11151 [Cladophialophora psammophila CBS 110553]